jgi:thioredoxin 1
MIILVGAGAAVGALVGAGQSCKTGACPLTANPRRGALWGAFLALMFGLSVNPGVLSATQRGEGQEKKKLFLEVETVKDFKKTVLKQDGKSLVYFHADWCGTCKKTAPMLNELAKKRSKDISFVKVDVDRAKELSRGQEITYLPTVLVFDSGKETVRFVGVPDKKELEQALKPAKAKTTGHETGEESNEH